MSADTRDERCEAVATDAGGDEQRCKLLLSDHARHGRYEFHHSASGLQWPVVPSVQSDERPDELRQLAHKMFTAAGSLILHGSTMPIVHDAHRLAALVADITPCPKCDFIHFGGCLVPPSRSPAPTPEGAPREPYCDCFDPECGYAHGPNRTSLKARLADAEQAARYNADVAKQADAARVQAEARVSELQSLTGVLVRGLRLLGRYRPVIGTIEDELAPAMRADDNGPYLFFDDVDTALDAFEHATRRASLSSGEATT